MALAFYISEPFKDRSMPSITQYLTGQQSSGFSGQTNANNQTKATGLAQTLTAASTAALGKPDLPDTSYLLNLSEEARNYLASRQTSEESSSDATSFVLTPAQQKTLETIITKYKDAPFTQESFNAMLDELDKVGLGPEQMAAKDQVKQMNSTALFLNALNGTSNGLTFSASNGEAQSAKANAYLDSIYDAWEGISTTAKITG